MKSFGHIAYDAYVLAAGGVSLVSGQPLPDWGSLPEAIQAAWEAAATAVRVMFGPVEEEGVEVEIYSDLGTMSGTYVQDGKPVEVVGITYPLPYGEDAYEDRCMTLACTKALIIDLQDALDKCMEHQQAGN